jgi:hypothetical protein
VFLDRDGTLIEEVGYLDDRSGRFFPGVDRASSTAPGSDRRHQQAGVARGFFDGFVEAASSIAQRSRPAVRASIASTTVRTTHRR